MFSLPIEGGINKCAFPFWPAPDDRQIFFFELSPLHQNSKSARDISFLCHQNQAAGFSIEPIHNGYLATGCNLEGEESTQLLPQRPCAIGFGGMNQEKRRLVDHSVIVSFIDDFEIE